ncbi:MAG: imidazolonepropionase [Bacillota bacterium]
MNSFNRNRKKIDADLIIADAQQLVTCNPDVPFHEGIIENGWIAIKGEKIVAVGSKEEVTAAADYNPESMIDAEGKVVVPGFVDSHTHLVFGGSRVDEYSLGLTTNDPVEFEKRGVRRGIMATVKKTRRESIDSLYSSAKNRLLNMLSNGTTTVESKSGYGLSLEAEKKLLEVNYLLQDHTPADIVPTFLGAHGWPADIPKNKYIDILLNEMIPWVVDRKMAKYCDIWCDEGKYTLEESKKILQTAKDYGLQPKIHTDAYSYIGGSDYAAEIGMVSADHLNYTPRKTMQKLAQSKTVGVLMPALDFAVQHPVPFDYRAMKEEGMDVALATNLCPGCWTESLQFVMVLACRLYGFSPDEALMAATMGGAKALSLDFDRGSLEAGKLADIQIWDVPTYEHVIYRFSTNVVDRVIKRGEIVINNGCLS